MNPSKSRVDLHIAKVIKRAEALLSDVRKPDGNVSIDDAEWLYHSIDASKLLIPKFTHEELAALVGFKLEYRRSPFLATVDEFLTVAKQSHIDMRAFYAYGFGADGDEELSTHEIFRENLERIGFDWFEEFINMELLYNQDGFLNFFETRLEDFRRYFPRNTSCRDVAEHLIPFIYDDVVKLSTLTAGYCSRFLAERFDLFGSDAKYAEAYLFAEFWTKRTTGVPATPSERVVRAALDHVGDGDLASLCGVELMEARMKELYDTKVNKA